MSSVHALRRGFWILCGILCVSGLKAAQVPSDVVEEKTQFGRGAKHPLQKVLPKEHPLARGRADEKDFKPFPTPTTPGPAMGDTDQAVTEVDYDLATRKEKRGSAATKRPKMLQLSTIGLGLDKAVEKEPKRNQSRTIFGTDNRTLVTNLTYYPWRTACKLFMTFPNGKKYIGSGIMIAPKYVLTAGHCVYWQADGGWATRVEVVPAYDGSYSPSYRPFGTAWASYYHAYTGWTSYQSWDHDFALIRLDRRIGNSTGWLGYGHFSSNTGVTGHTAGYPGDKYGGARQYYDYDPVYSETAYQVKFYTDIMKGQSGSGIWRTNSAGSRYVFGVVSWESASINGGCRINSSKASSINSWIASSP